MLLAEAVSRVPVATYLLVYQHPFNPKIFKVGQFFSSVAMVTRITPPCFQDCIQTCNQVKDPILSPVNIMHDKQLNWYFMIPVQYSRSVAGYVANMLAKTIYQNVGRFDIQMTEWWITCMEVSDCLTHLNDNIHLLRKGNLYRHTTTVTISTS